MKRFCHLAAVLIWFTAPLLVFLILRSQSALTCPFQGILTFNYRALLNASNAMFPLVFLAEFLPWTLISTLLVALPRHSGLKYPLIAVCAFDMLMVILNAVPLQVLLWDALFVLAILTASPSDRKI